MASGDDTGWLGVWQRKGASQPVQRAWTRAELFAVDGFDGAMAQTGAAAQQHIRQMVVDGLGLQAGWRVLEVGCGAGAVLSLIDDAGVQLTGVDYSPPHIEIARHALPSASFHVGEAAALPLPDGAAEAGFDAVFSYGVFLYFADLAYAERALDELLRVARPGAAVLVMDIPDAAKRDASEAARRLAGAHPNPPHLYYPKAFFADFAAARNRSVRVFDQEVPGYANGHYRFNVLIEGAACKP